MRLYLLQAIPGAPAFSPWYDKTFGFVVRAETEKQARDAATMHGGDEVEWDYEDDGPRRKVVSYSPWDDPKQTTCEPLEHDGEPGVILDDTRRA